VQEETICKDENYKSFHNYKLHQDKKLVAVNSSTETAQDPANILTVRNSTSMLLFKVLPIDVTGPNRSTLYVYALIDEGSFASLTDADLSAKLGVPGDAQKITLNWIENHKKKIPTIKCQLKVRTIEGATNWLPLTGSTVPSMELPTIT